MTSVGPTRWTVLIYACFVLATSLWAFKSPDYDWDVFAYAGCAAASHFHDPVGIHTAVFQTARREFSDFDFQENTGATAFRRDVASNPYHFAEQFPFYSIRPIFIQLIVLLHSLGLNYIDSAQAISAAALALLGVLLTIWAKLYVRLAYALGLGLVLLTPAFFEAGRSGTPDALSAAWLVLATYLLFEKRAMTAGLALLLASVFVRTDNVIIVIALLAYCAWTQHLETRWAVALAAVAGASVALIQRLAGNYGWAMLVLNSIDAIPNPGELVVHASWQSYVQLASDLPSELITEPGFLLLIVIAIAAIFSRRLPPRVHDLGIIYLATVPVHVVLFPLVSDRYFVACYSVFVLCGAIALFAPTGAASLRRDSGHRTAVVPVF